MEKKEVSQFVINRIMDRAIEINKQSKKHCRDFEIMISSERKEVLILRWLTIDISNIDNPVQCYHYECFELDGSPQLCSVYYSNQAEANAFFWSLKPLYKQQYAIDHKQ